MANILIEKWKPLIFTNGQYAISNFGKVKRVYKLSLLGKLVVVNKIIKSKFNKQGYEYLTLCFFDKGELFKINKRVHQLVCLAFVDNPQGKPCVNHINAIKSDNHFLNLEWCTVEENNNHAIKLGLIKVGRKERIKVGYRTRCKKVINTETGIIYSSVFHVSDEFGYPIRYLHARLGGHAKNKTPFKYVS